MKLSNASHLTVTVEVLTNLYPKLIGKARFDTEHAGQTPLHMAVCKGNCSLVEMMLKKLHLEAQSTNQRILHNVFTRTAIGTKFVNTVMMGELPLTIAALTTRTGKLDTCP